MGPARRLPSVAAFLVVLLLLAACGSSPGEEPTAAGSSDPPAAPDGEASTAADAGTPGREEPQGQGLPPREPEGAGSTGQVNAWFVRQGQSSVWLESENVRLNESTVEVLRAAVEAIINGRAANPDLTSFVPPETRLLDVRIEDGLALVDLSDDLVRAAGSSTEEVAFAQQLAQTSTQFATVDAVRLLVEGEPVSEVWGHVDWSEPLTADPQLLSPIIIDQPAWGSAQPGGPVTVSGTANTFESTVELRLIDPDGAVVEETFTTAAQPAVGQRGPWEHTFDAEAVTPGTWTIEAVEPDPSDGEGRPPFTTSVQFTVP